MSAKLCGSVITVFRTWTPLEMVTPCRSMMDVKTAGVGEQRRALDLHRDDPARERRRDEVRLAGDPPGSATVYIRSSGVTPNTSCMVRTRPDSQPPCTCTTPFGFPVDPEV